MKALKPKISKSKTGVIAKLDEKLESESEKSLNLSSIDSQLESEEDDPQSQLVQDYHEASIEVKISTNILKES